MISNNPKNALKKSDWEVDFYSRPIIEANGKKRWELLISSTPDISGTKPFRWEKICPASEVNSIWLKEALNEAVKSAKENGWEKPSVLRCWRSSMKTMIKRAAEQLAIDVLPSRRTYSLIEWIIEREKYIYPNEVGYMAGPLAAPPSSITNQPIPLPEAVRGDSWSLASLSIETLRDAEQWPIEFKGLIPIKETIDSNILIPGIRLFSKNRSLALAAWLGGLEPVKLVIDGIQVILEAGLSDRWLVTDIDEDASQALEASLKRTKDLAEGIQFISVQSQPDDQSFTGFWMLRDTPEI